MGWYWIALITLAVVWMITTLIAQFDEDYALYWAMGLVYPIARVLTYPIRALRTYERSRASYEKHGITKAQYFFGARAYKKRN